MRILITACILGVETSREGDEECCTIIMSIISSTLVSHTCVSFHYYTLLTSDLVKHLYKNHVSLKFVPYLRFFFYFFLVIVVGIGSWDRIGDWSGVRWMMDGWMGMNWAGISEIF